MNIKSFLLFTLAFLLQSLSLSAQEFNVMSLNIRLDTPNDHENAWPHRRDALAATIIEHQPGFLGVQEAMRNQIVFLDSVLLMYDYIGVGRDDGASGGEFSAIFYPTNQFTCLEQSTFWLSDTPDTASIGWDAAFKRVCTYGLFMHKATRERFWVFNTHFDHVGEIARRNSATLILEKIDSLTKGFQSPVILMGDFNATMEQAPFQHIISKLTYAMDISRTPFAGISGTFNAFITDVVPERRIDYVFVKNLEVLEYKHLEDRTPEGLWISDHLPVVARVNNQIGVND